jgi:hypothetical protein
MQFGQRMVQDHGQANEKLTAIAEEKGIELPQELPADAQQKYEELQQLSADEFDQAYMDEMVKDHEKDVQAFDRQAQSGLGPGSARLCRGDPADAARASGARQGGPAAGHGSARRQPREGRSARRGRPRGLKLQASAPVIEASGAGGPARLPPAFFIAAVPRGAEDRHETGGLMEMAMSRLGRCRVRCLEAGTGAGVRPIPSGGYGPAGEQSADLRPRLDHG